MDLILAKSLSGHDKNHIYVVLGEEEDFYLLVNGTTRKVDNPKKKKKIHVQIIKMFPQEIIDKIPKSINSNEEIKEILDSYNRRNINV